MVVGTMRRALALLKSDPSLFRRKAVSRLSRLPNGSVKRNINGVDIEFDLSRNWAGWTYARDQLHNLYELELVTALKEFLHPGDTFIDVGANSGYISGLAAGFVGTLGHVHSFEPVPAYCARVKKLAAANPTYSILPIEIALSDSAGTASISVSQNNAGWNTMVDGFMEVGEVAEVVEIQTMRLDDYLKSVGNPKVAVIKIDTEGFEFPVLRGLSGYLETVTRPPILCEVAPHAYKHTGASLEDLHAYMAGYGYVSSSFASDGQRTPFDVRSATETVNVLWKCDADS